MYDCFQVFSSFELLFFSSSRTFLILPYPTLPFIKPIAALDPAKDHQYPGGQLVWRVYHENLNHGSPSPLNGALLDPCVGIQRLPKACDDTRTQASLFLVAAIAKEKERDQSYANLRKRKLSFIDLTEDFTGAPVYNPDDRWLHDMATRRLAKLNYWRNLK